MHHRLPLVFVVFSALFLLVFPALSSAASGKPEMAWPEQSQYAGFPIPLEKYTAVDGGLVATLRARVQRDPFNLVASVIFVCAILHTFAAGFFNKWAHEAEESHRAKLILMGKGDPEHPEAMREVSFRSTMLHFLGEVEAVFGIWSLLLAGAAVYYYSWNDFTAYLHFDRHFGEPMFVVVIMAMASSRPVLRFAEQIVSIAAKFGKFSPAAWWLSILTIAPVLGSFITEPAAITIGALLLAKKFYCHKPSPAFAYGTIGLLFVNISVGGVLTHFAAPPVLMVAGKWGWDTPFMVMNFGYKAVLAIFLSNVAYFLAFRAELGRMALAAGQTAEGYNEPESWADREHAVPPWVTACHVVFLAWTVINVHHPVLFFGGFLFFMAFVLATEHHQNAIRLRGPIMVGFFLAGLIIHGGCQGWWIEPIIKTLSANGLMLGATILTAFNDNAAITYLAAQVDGISEASKLAVVAGAVTGGGLTVIANAPNPAGQSILARFFPGGVSPLRLFLGALLPTVVCYMAFVFLPCLKKTAEKPPVAAHAAVSAPVAPSGH